ncbi:MAG: 4Fe-4S dicluster domain-containing protein [Lachnospiraceae bacterium]|jgi:iron only hydrogenase large subunit-like protein|nr:4Fe-4S dicluster domain-containing protein [Lachnospiraceae bacterium]
MENFYHSIYLDKDLCKGCLNCIKRCPTQAIRVRNGKAVINNKFCIDCGECIRICPHHAKLARRDTLDILKKYEYTVALPAPSLYTQYNNITDTNLILNALMSLGFNDVFEVSAAAELVSEATIKYIDENKDKWPIISSACPSIVRLIRVRFPNLIEHLLPLKAPIEVAAEMALEKAVSTTGLPRNKIGLIFITPCPAKVTYAKEPLGIEKSEVDAVIAIKDIYVPLLEAIKDLSAEQAEGGSLPNLAASGKIGVGWSCTGGESTGTVSDNYLAADGISNVIEILENLEDERFKTLNFIELNACTGGCVGGVLTVENPYISHSKNKHLKKYLPVKVSSFNNRSTTVYTEDIDLNWNKEIVYEPVFRIGNNFMEGLSNLNAVEKIVESFPGLDCGSCGAPTCRALAEDIVRGEASDTACIHIFKEYFNFLTLQLSTLTHNMSNASDAGASIANLEQNLTGFFNQGESGKQTEDAEPPKKDKPKKKK